MAGQHAPETVSFLPISSTRRPSPTMAPGCWVWDEGRRGYGKGRGHRGHGHGGGGLAKRGVSRRVGERARGARAHLGKDAEALYPNPPRGQGHGRAVAV